MGTSRTKRKRSGKYKSGFEEKVAKELERLNHPVVYEEEKLTYVIPESTHTYKPDFKIAKNVFLEAKGKFVAADRKKHLLVKKQHPDKRIILVFMRPFNRLSKVSKTTYAKWCTDNNIAWIHFNQIKSILSK